MEELKKAIIAHLDYLTEAELRDLFRLVWIILTRKR